MSAKVFSKKFLETWEPSAKDDGFNELVLAMRQSPRPVALLGAGVSIDSGYPSWKGLLDEMRRIALNSPSATTSETSSFLPPKYAEYIEKHDPTWAAELYITRMGRESFGNFIGSRFSYSKNVGYTHKLVASLNFRHILTTNYEPCAEEAVKEIQPETRTCSIRWNKPQEVSNFLFSLHGDLNQKYIAYLHGRYDDPDGIVLSHSSYSNYYLQSDGNVKKMLAVFLTTPIVFIGFSLEDPDFIQILREVPLLIGREKYPHFAILPSPRKNLIANERRRFREKFGITPVYYPSSPGNHECLHRLLRAVAKETNILSPDVPTPLPIPKIKARNLENHPITSDETTEKPSASARENRSARMDPLDPNKRMFGGRANVSNFELKTRILDKNEEEQYCKFNIFVETPTDVPDGTKAIFFLHPTFPKREYERTFSGRKAVLEDVLAYGAFTIGVELPDHGVKLELDIADPRYGFPAWFRAR